MIDHRSCIDNSKAEEFKPEQNSGLSGIRTHALCDNGAVLYQLSYQVNWQELTLKAHNIPVDGEKCSWVRVQSRQEH